MRRDSAPRLGFGCSSTRINNKNHNNGTNVAKTRRHRVKAALSKDSSFTKSLGGWANPVLRCSVTWGNFFFPFPSLPLFLPLVPLVSLPHCCLHLFRLSFSCSHLSNSSLQGEPPPRPHHTLTTTTRQLQSWTTSSQWLTPAPFDHHPPSSSTSCVRLRLRPRFQEHSTV